MLVGGVMGHAQALINPYVYGLRWRRSVLMLGSTLVDANLSMGSSAKRTLVDAKLGPTPSQHFSSPRVQPFTSPGCTICQPFTSPGCTPSQDMIAMRVSPLPSPPASEYASEYGEGGSGRVALSPLKASKAKGGKRNAVAPGPPYIV